MAHTVRIGTMRLKILRFIKYHAPCWIAQICRYLNDVQTWECTYKRRSSDGHRWRRRGCYCSHSFNNVYNAVKALEKIGFIQTEKTKQRDNAMSRGYDYFLVCHRLF